MKELFKDFLFTKGFFVSDSESSTEHTFEVLFSLANLLGIKITEGAERASAEMISFAERNLGTHVPRPFYRGFPQSVRRLSSDELLFDQLLHYFTSYGLGHFDEPGYSVMEEQFERTAFRENFEIRKFAILTETQAEERLGEYVENLLASSRPLSEVQYNLVREYVQEYSYTITSCACKDTAVRILLDTRDASYARLLVLSDVIRLVEQLQYEFYGSENIKKLNLRNTDRKFITKVLDSIFRSGRCDVINCFEKKKLWCGLLHHIHYKPKNRKAEEFLAAMRGSANGSAYSKFESLIAAGDIGGAAAWLKESKGSAAVLRNLSYLLSRCTRIEDVQTLLDNVESDNIIVLIQLLLNYSRKKISTTGRVFKFTKYNKLRVHKESTAETAARRSHVPLWMHDVICKKLRENLEAACKGKLGKVYVSEKMKNVALPLQETTSQGGLGVLPKGTRIPLAFDKKIRAFTYWERVNDIDLSTFGITESGKQVEFSWRTMAGNQSSGLTFSGDQTRGYNGGSEYFDIDIAAIKELNPNIRYMLFCNNVFSGTPFSDCLCKAGYMLRDIEDSGEVFEPKTVATSFAINCESTFAYLFVIDLERECFVWLNVARESKARVAGATDMLFLLDYMDMVDVISLYDFVTMLATEVVDNPKDADVVVSDEEITLPEGAELIRSCDFERILALMNK